MSGDERLVGASPQERSPGSNAGVGSGLDHHGPQPLLHHADISVAVACALDLGVLNVARLLRTWGVAGLTVALMASEWFTARRPTHTSRRGDAGFRRLLSVHSPASARLLVKMSHVSYHFFTKSPPNASVRIPVRPTQRRHHPEQPAVAGTQLYRRGRRRFGVSSDCVDPRRWLQGHGLWHSLTALAFGLWAVTVVPDRAPTSAEVDHVAAGG